MLASQISHSVGSRSNERPCLRHRDPQRKTLSMILWLPYTYRRRTCWPLPSLWNFWSSDWAGLIFSMNFGARKTPIYTCCLKFKISRQQAEKRKTGTQPRGRLWLLPGLGFLPRLADPEKTLLQALGTLAPRGVIHYVATRWHSPLFHWTKISLQTKRI